MDWKQALRDERATLQRMIALLLALADLAERANRRSRAACALMLWILHPGAAAVLACLDDGADMTFHSGDVRDDLLAVESCFRAFALVLSRQARIGFSTKDAGGIKDLPRDPSGIPHAASVPARLCFAQPVMSLNTS